MNPYLCIRSKEWLDILKMVRPFGIACNRFEGIYVELVGEEVINLVATDGHRLCCYGINKASSEIERGVLLPPWFLDCMESLAKAYNSSLLVLAIKELEISFYVSATSYGASSPIWDGTYPDWRSIIPSPHDNLQTLVVKRSDLTKLLGSTTELDYILPLGDDGPALNTAYVQDALRLFPRGECASLTLTTKGKLNAVSIKDTEDTNRQAIIMPMRID